MITAKEAREFSAQNIDKLYERELKDIENSIKAACAEGRYQCYVDGSYSSTTLTYLRDNGYGISFHSDEYPYIRVFWREEDDSWDAVTRKFF